MSKIVKTEEIDLLFGNILEIINTVSVDGNVISKNVKHQRVEKDNVVKDITEFEFKQERSLNLELEIEEKQKELYKLKEELEKENKKESKDNK
jgi:ABC-type phosphate transport system auxiliary subunit